MDTWGPGRDSGSNNVLRATYVRLAGAKANKISVTKSGERIFLQKRKARSTTSESVKGQHIDAKCTSR